MDVMHSMAVFRRVVEAKNFSAVARETNMSQSTVSKHIAALEERAHGTDGRSVFRPHVKIIQPTLLDLDPVHLGTEDSAVSSWRAQPQIALDVS